MANLTKKQKARLERILYDATRARDYIMHDSIAVCRKYQGVGGTSLDYRRGDGAYLSEVMKEYGSHLCGINDAIERLREFILTS